MSGHLDMTLIGELKELMEDDFAELVQTYLADSELRRDQIRQAVANQSAADIRQTAHSLKGASSNLGAPALAALCQTLEEAGRTNNCAAAPALWQQIEHELTSVQSALRALL